MERKVRIIGGGDSSDFTDTLASAGFTVNVQGPTVTPEPGNGGFMLIGGGLLLLWSVLGGLKERQSKKSLRLCSKTFQKRLRKGSIFSSFQAEGDGFDSHRPAP